MFVSKYSSTGTRVWRKFYQSPYASFPVSVPLAMSVSPQGKIVILAYHRGTNNVNDLHIFQYADDGTLAWHKDVDNASGNLVILNGFEIESNGDIVVFGTSGGGRYVLKKYDSGGNEKWSDKGILSSRTSSQSVIDDSGNIYTAFSSPDGLIIKKYDENGNFLLQKSHSFTSPGSFFIPRALIAMNSQIVVLGQHIYEALTTIPFEMLLDEQLNEVSSTIHYSEHGDFVDYSVNESGDIYELWQIPTYKGAYIYYSSVKKLTSDPVGISDLDSPNDIIHLYPNPAYDQLYLTTEKNGEFRIYNVYGQLVLTELITSPHSFIDIQKIKPGIYIWRMNNKQGKLIIK